MSTYITDLLSWMVDELPAFIMSSPVADFVAVFLLSFVACLVFRLIRIWRG